MDDLISRQAAIDTITLGKEMLSRVLDDMDVIGQEREKYSWGLGLIESNIADIKELPSAQPEIIRCKDCSRWAICHHSDDVQKAINWIINISADIGKAEHRDLWHYEQALSEIREMLESAQPERKKGWWIDAEKAPFDMWYATCSECGKRQTLDFLNYCPNCGSDNRGDKDANRTPEAVKENRGKCGCSRHKCRRHDSV